MELPEYEYAVSPVTGLQPTHIPLLPAHFGQALARSLVIGGRMLEASSEVDTRLEESRLAVRKAKFFMEMDTDAATARENPNLDLSPEQNQRAYGAMAAQKVQAFAGTVGNERLRNQFLAESFHRIGAHAIQVRHDATKAWHDDALAGAEEVYQSNLQRYQLAGDPMLREAIRQEQFRNIDDLVAGHVMWAKNGERVKQKWMRSAEMGAAEYDGRIHPEETIAGLFRTKIDERGETTFEDGRALTMQERRVVAHNILADQERKEKAYDRARKEAQEEDRRVVINSVKRGELGGVGGMPFDWRALDSRISGWTEEAQASFSTHVREWLKSGAGEADSTASKHLAAEISLGTVNASPKLLTQKLQQADAAVAAGKMRPEEAEPLRRHLRAEQEHQIRLSEHYENREEHLRAVRERRAKASAMAWLNTWIPLKRPKGVSFDDWANARAEAQSIIQAAIDAGQNPTDALIHARPMIEQTYQGGTKEAAQDNQGFLKRFKSTPALPAVAP